MSLNCSSTGSGGGGSGGGGGGGPCGACKFLRRKCVAGCIFAPYFDSDQGASVFASVHKVFGASNVSKLLHHIPPHKRLDAVITVCFEAQARLRDPVYGCVAHIFAIQQQVVNLQAELSFLQAHLASLQVPTPPPPPMSAAINIADLSTVSPAAYDTLSSLFDPTSLTTVQAAWPPPVQQTRHFNRDPAESSSSPPAGSGVLQELTRHLMRRPPQGC
ncbi:LOB domain-containing protein 30-like [Ipomoea triloba]|uniref:LOB domain-containing protein 30-like n=1 Tax=Ipomoea triloba TaxID=35885 RepID=UPI00125D85DB|nr:LOB domain-containing protein 30-like [Ipomoea triloba]